MAIAVPSAVAASTAVVIDGATRSAAAGSNGKTPASFVADAVVRLASVASEGTATDCRSGRRPARASVVRVSTASAAVHRDGWRDVHGGPSRRMARCARLSRRMARHATLS